MTRICGLDECGRGPLAGPLVACAVVLNSKSLYFTKTALGADKFNDSKKLNSQQRERIHKVIIRSEAIVEVEIISVRQINTRGIGWANREIFRRLIKKVEADKYIVDGNLKLGRIKNKTQRIKSVIKADATRKCVMAASIVAKVTRDRLMTELHKDFPHYDWHNNAGYGTRKHIEAIRQHGVTKHHRSVFVRTALKHRELNSERQDNFNN